MLISWIKKTTLLDYPWKIACIIFTSWCNLRCKYCHNSEFVLPEKISKIKDFIPENVFFNFLKTKVWLIDWVVICWWEPSLQKYLFDFCKKVKDLWFLVKLDTNWFSPKVLKNLLDNDLLDYIAMDIKAPLNRYDLISDIFDDEKNYRESIDIIMKSKIDYEFRTTIVSWIHNENDIEEIAKTIIWAKNYYLQNFLPWNTLDNSIIYKSFSKEKLEVFQKIAKVYLKNVFIRY